MLTYDKMLPFISVAFFLFRNAKIEWKYLGFFGLAKTNFIWSKILPFLTLLPFLAVFYLGLGTNKKFSFSLSSVEYQDTSSTKQHSFLPVLWLVLKGKCHSITGVSCLVLVAHILFQRIFPFQSKWPFFSYTKNQCIRELKLALRWSLAAR